MRKRRTSGQISLFGQDSNSFPDTSLSKGFSSSLNEGDKHTINIATALIRSDDSYSNHSRFLLLERLLSELDDKVSIIVLPGGFFKIETLEKVEIASIEESICNLLKRSNKTAIVCFGIDTNNEELGVAISNKGIEAFCEKFYYHDRIIPSKGNIGLWGYQRYFVFKRQNFYLAVCYDSKGIYDLPLPKENNVSFILNLIHAFYPKGDGMSGDSSFARKLMLGASKYWECPIIGATLFVHRDVPTN
ncbi:hypothetical protein [Algivirga pacifica]|uniref:Uncharacterized protein n=1 Tax=Algivirga pacifica TaxID=1162670 RepID=A0ABP9DI72_9BACT